MIFSAPEDIDRSPSPSDDSKQSKGAKSQSPYSKMINMDISMNMIKEVDEG